MLNLINYYYIKVTTHDFKRLSKIKAINIVSDDNYVYFYISKSNINLLKDINYIILNDYSLSKLVKTNIILILGALIILVMFYVISFTVTDIIVEDEFYISEESNTKRVVEEVEKYIYTFGKIKFLKEATYNINRNLKAKFTDINWISIKKIGTKIYIETIFENYEYITDNSKTSNLISSDDCFIKSIICYSGKLNVSINQSVRKNDVLVESKCIESVVKTKAIVIGEVVEYKKIVVNKLYFDTLKSGKVKSKNVFTIFKKMVNKTPNYYQNYSNEYIYLWKFYDIFSLIKVVQYEIIDVNMYISKDFAKTISDDLLLDEYNDNSKYMKFIDSVLLRVDETKDTYEFSYLVTYQKNVAIYEK